MVDADLNLHALQAGGALCTFLFGMTTVHVYTYFSATLREFVYMKIVMLLVWLIEVILIIFTWILISHMVVNNEDGLKNSTWTIRGILICTGIIQSFTQAFYAFRTRVLSKKYLVASIVWAGVVIRFGIILAATLLTTSRDTVEDFLVTKYLWLFTTALAEGMVIDLVNTIALFFYYFRRKVAFPGTIRTLEKGVIHSLEAGSVTCMCATSLAILIATGSGTMPGVILMLLIIFPHLYSFSMAVSLTTVKNGRIRNQTGDRETSTSIYRSSRANFGHSGTSSVVGLGGVEMIRREPPYTAPLLGQGSMFIPKEEAQAVVEIKITPPSGSN